MMLPMGPGIDPITPDIRMLYLKTFHTPLATSSSGPDAGGPRSTLPELTPVAVRRRIEIRDSDLVVTARNWSCSSFGGRKYMCLVVIAYDHHPDYWLIFGANRDEFRNRPTDR